MKTIIVDKNDKYLTIKDSDKITQNDIYRVSALWLINPNEQILIAQRKLTKQHDPGKWGPAAAGTLEEGETYKSNMYKEAEEEIGLKRVPFKLGPKVFNQGKHTYFVQWFICNVDWAADKFAIQKNELEKVAWVDKVFLQSDIDKNPDKYVKNAYKWRPLFKY